MGVDGVVMERRGDDDGWRDWGGEGGKGREEGVRWVQW